MLKQGSAIGETALAMASAPLKGQVICTNPYYKTRAGVGWKSEQFYPLTFETHCYRWSRVIFTLFIVGSSKWFLIVFARY